MFKTNSLVFLFLGLLPIGCGDQKQNPSLYFDSSYQPPFDKNPVGLLLTVSKDTTSIPENGCTASVIENGFILTAAHCIYGDGGKAGRMTLEDYSAVYVALQNRNEAHSKLFLIDKIVAGESEEAELDRRGAATANDWVILGSKDSQKIVSRYGNLFLAENLPKSFYTGENQDVFSYSIDPTDNGIRQKNFSLTISKIRKYFQESKLVAIQDILNAIPTLSEDEASQMYDQSWKGFIESSSMFLGEPDVSIPGNSGSPVMFNNKVVGLVTHSGDGEVWARSIPWIWKEYLSKLKEFSK